MKFKIGLFIKNPYIFDLKYTRDFYAYRWNVLKKVFKNNDIELNVCLSKRKIKYFDILIDIGIKNYKFDVKRRYLIMVESPLVRPNDWNIKKHSKYHKIFTWDDNLIDNQKYIKVNYAFKIPKSIPKKFYNKKLCCCIAGNKKSSHPDELYSKRVAIIRWFEENHLDDFDLFGFGWDEYAFDSSNVLGKFLNKIKPLKKILSHKFPSYKGVVKSKFDTFKKYKFAICYENIKDQKGYITEKIFDCLFAGCIPIYWGASNVTKYIPKECFIDKREFDNYNDLYNFINKMDKKTYMKYLDSIENFLRSDKVKPFKAETFADTIITEIIKDINKS